MSDIERLQGVVLGLGHEATWTAKNAKAAREWLSEQLAAARAEGRKKGFEKAREMAAVAGADAAAAYDARAIGIDVHTGKRGVAIASAIRAMRDEAGEVETTPAACACGHEEGWHHYNKKRGCMKKMDDRTTCTCMEWRPAVTR